MISSMDEWEYTVLRIDFYFDWPRVVDRDDRDAGGPLVEPKLHRYLNKIGGEGWEVVGIIRDFILLKRLRMI
ncbi:MAG: hypothetical protein GWN30_01560 [Gammaproteobacteria bacterium]|nr:hypothetical protein [Gammaproteobacteria bacterium]